MNQSSDFSRFVVWVPVREDSGGKHAMLEQDPKVAFTVPNSASVPVTSSPTSSSGIHYSVAEIRRMGRKPPKQQEISAEKSGDPDSRESVGASNFGFDPLNKDVSEPDLKENENDGLPFCITKVWSISAEAGDNAGKDNPDTAGNFQVDIPPVVNISSPVSSPIRLLENQRSHMDMQAQKGQLLLQNLISTTEEIVGNKDELGQTLTFERIPAATSVKTKESLNYKPATEEELDLNLIVDEDDEDSEPPANKKSREVESGLSFETEETEKVYPKPPYSYACLIAIALKNSQAGCLPVSEIYRFLFDHFPYFKSAPSGWKDQIRSYLKTKYFEKSNRLDDGIRKGNFWTTNPAMIPKFDKEMQKWSSRNYARVISSLSDPENLELLEKGKLIRDYSGSPAFVPVKKGQQSGTIGRPRGRPKGSKGRKSNA